MDDNIRQVYEILLNKYGPQGWWPLLESYGGLDEGRGGFNCAYHKKNYTIPCTSHQYFEIIIGAILTQNTAWKNVEKALKNMNGRRVINPATIMIIPEHELAELIRPSGYFNQKAQRLKIVSKFFFDSCQFDFKKLIKQDPIELRKQLLSVNGIGPETADSIMLYAFHKPFFVVDTYTRRIFFRLGLLLGKDENEKTYEEIQSMFHDNLPREEVIFNEFHALIVELAKNNCKKEPVCKDCPLSQLCEYSKNEEEKLKEK